MSKYTDDQIRKRAFAILRKMDNNIRNIVTKQYGEKPEDFIRMLLALGEMMIYMGGVYMGGTIAGGLDKEFRERVIDNMSDDDIEAAVSDSKLPAWFSVKDDPMYEKILEPASAAVDEYRKLAQEVIDRTKNSPHATRATTPKAATRKWWET